MLTIYRKRLRDKNLSTLKEPVDGSLIVGEDVTREELNQVADWVGLEYSDVKDTLDPYEIPRVERENGALLLFVRHPTEPDEGMFTLPLVTIFTKKLLVVLSSQKSTLVAELLEDTQGLSTQQRAKLLLKLLLKVSRLYTKEIKRVSDVVGKLKKAVRVVGSRDIIDLSQNEEVLNQYLSALVPLKNVFETVLSHGYVPLAENTGDLFEDVQIAINQSVDVCTVNLRSIGNLREVYQAIFTNELNKTIKFLTAVTIVLTIPMIVTSVYGMNVDLPWQEELHAFSIVMAMIGLFSLVVLVIFRFKRWF